MNSKTHALHYTVGVHWPKIMADGVLNTTPRRSQLTFGESPFVWFSTNDVWETTAGKGLQTPDGENVGWATFEETHYHGKGLYRIAVEQRHLKRWRDVRGQQPRGVVLRLEGRAKDRHANPKDWMVSAEPVPAVLWAYAERWDGRVWVPEPVVLTPEARVERSPFATYRE